MSTIREKPYIEELLASMSEQNLNDLKTILDSGGDNVNLSFATLTDSYKNKVTPVYFQFEDNGLKTGILIWTDTKCALICYHRFQDLIIFEFSPTYHTYTKIKQYCDINELRRVLDDTIEKKGAVDSGDAAEGSVPFADGEGGVTWDKPTEYIKGDDFEDAETTVKMIAIDDEGNLVKADLPEGTFVVDSALSNVSENPVQNKVIKKYVDDLQDNLEEGNIVVGKSKQSKTLQNVSENSGSMQEDPFICQATATNNNTTSTSTSPVANQLEKQGNTVVVNQLSKELNTTNWQSQNANASFNSGVATFTATNQYGGIKQALSITSYHKCIIIVKLKTTTATNLIQIATLVSDGTGFSKYCSSTTNEQIVYLIGSENVEITGLLIRDNRSSDRDAIQVKDVYIVDLTQWFGSNENIPSHLLDHPETFINYYNGSLDYNEGTLVSSNGRYLVTIGFNLWDEEWELGSINTSTGEQQTSDNTICSSNFTRVIPNAICYVKCPSIIYGCYYDVNKNYIGAFSVNNSTILIPNNAVYLKFYIDGTTYNYNICFNQSWDGERDGEYEDFVKYSYDTGTETLLSAGSVKDIKAFNGTITRNVGTYTFTGNETFSRNTEAYSFPIWICDLNLPLSAVNKAKGIQATCSKLVNSNDYISQLNNGEFGLNDLVLSDARGVIGVRMDSITEVSDFQSFIAGATLYYELATPTTEQGTRFSSVIEVEDYSIMYWLDTNGNFVAIPQGCKIFYQADYTGLIDDLGNLTDYDVNNLALKSDINTDKTELQAVDIQLLNAIGGTLRQCLCVKESLNFNNTAVVDLGTLNYSYSGEYFLATDLTPLANTSWGTELAPKALCTLYATNAKWGDIDKNIRDMRCSAYSNQVKISNSNYSDVTTFKNAMKGVLLAYEKASE